MFEFQVILKKSRRVVTVEADSLDQVSDKLHDMGINPNTEVQYPILNMGEVLQVIPIRRNRKEIALCDAYEEVHPLHYAG